MGTKGDEDDADGDCDDYVDVDDVRNSRRKDGIWRERVSIGSKKLSLSFRVQKMTAVQQDTRQQQKDEDYWWGLYVDWDDDVLMQYVSNNNLIWVYSNYADDDVMRIK